MKLTSKYNKILTSNCNNIFKNYSSSYSLFKKLPRLNILNANLKFFIMHKYWFCILCPLMTAYNSSVFSKSFLCYGIGEAMNRYQYYLITKKDNLTSKVVYNPCLPKGFKTVFTSEDFLKPCVLSNKNEKPLYSLNSLNKYVQRFGMKYIFSNISKPWDEPEQAINGSKEEYVLKGTSNKNLCLKTVENLFDFELCQKNFVLGDCLNKKLVPSYEGKLVGFSKIFHNLLPLLGFNKEVSLEKYKTAVFNICSMSSKKLIYLYPSKLKFCI